MPQTREVLSVASCVLAFAFILFILYGASGIAVCAFRPIDANANLTECK